MTTSPRCSNVLAVLTLALCAAPAAYAQGAFTPGTSYFGANGYIEYVAGNLPIIISAPHGGTLQPASIPARTAAACGEDDFSTVRDLNTDELATAIQAAFFARTGKYPHVIINRLHRNRLDANRPLDGGACGNADAVQAWNEFQDYIGVAKAAVTAEFGRGWFTDIHGHGHAVQRLELGYNMTGATLRNDDTTLDGDPAFEASTSIHALSAASPRSFSDILRGPTSIGTLFEAAGIPATPSAQDPAPLEGQAFFSGGYNTRAHGCMDGGTICGLQIEANLTGVRDTGTNRYAFAMKMVDVYDEFLFTNFDLHLPAPPPPHTAGHQVIVDNLNANNDLEWARFEASSNWSNGSNSGSWNPPSFGLANASSSATNDGAELFFLITTPGAYAVDTWWPAAASRSLNASYRLFEVDLGELLLDTTRNQRINGSQWNSLGTFAFNQTGWGKVLLSRSLSTTGSIAADAVRVTLVTPFNRAPSARAAVPLSGREGDAIAFDGTRSFDRDHDALTHAWSLGDGGFDAGPLATHAFANDGTFAVTLTVTDANSATGAMTRSIVVSNVAPAVDPIDGATILQGETFSTSGSFSDPGADAWTAIVNYGDGSLDEAVPLAARRFTLSHTYDHAGVFTVAVDVFDGDDHGTTTAQVTVLTPAEGITALAAMAPQHSLTTKLGAVLSSIEAGRAHTAINQINAFIKEVDAMVRSGRLATGDDLIGFAERIVNSLQQ